MSDNIYNIFREYEESHPIQETVDPVTHEPSFTGMNPTTGAMDPNPYPNGYQPQYFNSNRYIDAYDSQYFGSNILAVEMFENKAFVPVIDRRIDPNKIFTPDIQAMKSLASEQYKTVNLFEKKFIEDMKDKSHYGLTENDIAAMQAITSGRAAIANINKEIVNIKKNATEIRLKQQLNSQNNSDANVGAGAKPQSADAIGRNIMDNLFKMSTPINEAPVSYNAPSVDPESQADLDELLPKVDSDTIEYEPLEPTTYVVVNEDQSIPPRYETRAKDGHIIADYPTSSLPDLSEIKEIDRDGKKVVFNNEIRFDLKIENNDNDVIDADFS